MSSDEEFELEDEPAVDGAGRACGAGEEDASSVGGKASEVSGDYASSSEDDGSAGSDEFVPSGGDGSDNDDASYDADDSDEERRRAAPGRKKPTQKRKAGRQKKNGKRRRKGKKRPRGVSEDAFIDTSDDDESDGNDSYQPDDSGEEQSIPRRRRGGARQCTARTNEKMSQVLREEKRTERDALGDAVPGEDKQYLQSSASDDEDGGNAGMAKRAPSCKPKARKLRRMHSDEDVGSNLGSVFGEASDGSGSDDTSGNGASLQIKPTHFQANHSSALKHKTVNCPSEKDALTKLNLPKTNAHVCCLLKDGTRFCYTLGTMHRIAIAKNCKKNGRLQFMQPPEFTSPMDGDMIDRIQYLFGRDALVIEDSSVYKEMMQRAGDRSNFLRFVSNLKGCPDLCCCPLCYNEAYRRQGNLIGKSLRATSDSEGESEEEEWSDSDNSDAARRIEESEEDPLIFLDDPMTILQNVGLEKAATFCFRLLSSLKEHIKAVHGFDPSVMNGNGLFHRFQIRSADGLLQHWLPIRYEEIWEGKGVSDPKYYRRYWRKHGNSGPFNDLYNIIDKAWLRGEQSGDYASDFSSSLKRTSAKKDWQRLIAPYLKSRRKDDIKDMIDDRSVHEAAGPRPMLEEDKSNLEEEFAAHLHKKNEELGGNDGESSEESSKGASSQAGSPSEGSGSESQSESEEDEDAEEEDEEVEEGEEEEEEEDPVDEWMKEKVQRPTAARMRKRDDDSEDDSLFDSQPKKNVVTPGVLFESDEDDD